MLRLILTTFSTLIKLLLVLKTTVSALDNGVAQTPPMGWNSWLGFGCSTDCKSNPLRCISEKLVMDMADRMASEGYKEAGYTYINLDDCWLADRRDSRGNLQPDPDRFPRGIKWLTDYVHSKGLKFGIYEDYGTKTCAGFPGSLDNVERDAQTFADWGVDYVKFDACNVDHDAIDIGYPQMSLALNKTGRPMVYSCEWPFYTQFYQHKKPNYTAVRHHCNVWRVFDDIGTDWPSIMRTIDYFDANQDDLISINRPGGWNDPDMLAIGHPGLTLDQAKVQFALWSIWSAPLLMSTDLRFIVKGFKDILLNRKVLAINQDQLGVMGRLVVNTTNVAVYIKPVMPLKTDANDASFAVAFFNRNTSFSAVTTLKSLASIGLKNEQGYDVEDLFNNSHYGVLYPNTSVIVAMKPTSVVLLKATIL